MADDLTNTANATASLSSSLEGLSTRTHDLEISAGSFSRAMASAFTSSVAGGKQLDDVLKSLALRHGAHLEYEQGTGAVRMGELR